MTALANKYPPLKLAVLISGNGSNLQAFIDSIANKTLNAEITLVISNKAEAYGLKRAEAAHIPTMVLPAKPPETSHEYGERLIAVLKKAQPDLILLAGFMKILAPNVIKAFPHQILNIHPSLLPKYPGLNTHQRVLDAKELEHGVSIHLVTAELDGGPILVQDRITVAPGVTLAELEQQIHTLEHQLYPAIVRAMQQKQLIITKESILWDDKPIVSSGVDARFLK